MTPRAALSLSPPGSLAVRRARAVAAIIGLGTGVNVVTSGMAANPATSLFLVPDLLVVALLLAAAATPTRRAGPVLLVALGTATGVFTTAAMAYVLRGEVGWGVTAFAVIVATTAALLALRTSLTIDTRGTAASSGPGAGIV